MGDLDSVWQMATLAVVLAKGGTPMEANEVSAMLYGRYVLGMPPAGLDEMVNLALLRVRGEGPFKGLPGG